MLLEQVVRHRPGGRAVLELQRDRVRLEHPDPDRQRPLPRLVPEYQDGHVGDRVHHQALDQHSDGHQGSTSNTSPRTLFGPAAVIAHLPPACRSIGDRPPHSRRCCRWFGRTTRARVDGWSSRSAPAPPSRPSAGAGRTESPAAAPATRQYDASSRLPATSSGIRLMASVRGRGEYLKLNMLWNRAAAVEAHRVVEVLGGLAGEADDHVRREADVGYGLPDLLEDLEVPLARVATSHRREHTRRAGLHRQVQVAADLRQRAIRLEQARRDVTGMRAGKADPRPRHSPPAPAPAGPRNRMSRRLGAW